MNVTEVPAQTVVAVAAILTVGVTVGLTIIVTEFDVAVGADKQVAVDVITHVTIFPFARVVLVNVAPVPEFTPFTFHWYVGAPPFTGVGVNVTEVPAQIVVAVSAILTVVVTVGLTIIVTEFEVAVGAERQVAVEVITQVTIFPFARVVLVNVAPVPEFTPFTFH